MAWTDPRTWLAGELVKEDDLNTHIRDNLLVLKASLDDTGKLLALSSSYIANLSGAALTGVAKTGSDNNFTAGVHDFNAGSATRVILPVGPDKWAT